MAGLEPPVAGRDENAGPTLRPGSGGNPQWRGECSRLILPAYIIRAFATEDIGYYRESRGAFLGDSPPASTLLFVAGLADPAMVVEIEAICVK